jgi:maltose alpha-D-glucosyltransferase/alpha-amylase
MKRAALGDVAGMIRSFHYAASQAYFRQAQSGVVGPDGLAGLRFAARFWYRWASSAFLRSYLSLARQGTFLPTSRGQQETLLNVLIMEKAVYELGYELNNRPDWVEVPLKGILDLLETRP